MNYSDFGQFDHAGKASARLMGFLSKECQTDSIAMIISFINDSLKEGELNAIFDDGKKLMTINQNFLVLHRGDTGEHLIQFLGEPTEVVQRLTGFT